MKGKIIAKRYAKALFDLAIEKDLQERINHDALLIYDVCVSNREFILVLRSPVIKEKKKLAIIDQIFRKHLHELTLSFLKIITSHRREGIIKEIAKQIIEIYKKYKNIITTTLTTAVKLNDDIRKRIIALLKEQTKAEIELHEEINEELIGGFVLSYDDKQYDASIITQLQKLHHEFDENLYIKGY